MTLFWHQNATFYFLIRKFTIRLKPHLYNKLKIYADDNGFSTVMGLIRFILTDFFKDKNII